MAQRTDSTLNEISTPPIPRGPVPLDGCWRSHRRTGSYGEMSEVIESDGEGIFVVPTSSEGPGYDVSETNPATGNFAFIMVGLPARGKTFIAQKLCRLLAWQGHKAKVYNVQNVWKDRLRAAGKKEFLADDYDITASPEQLIDYKNAIDSCLTDVVEFYEQGGLVAFLNDDFVTEQTRQYLEDKFLQRGVQVTYIEIKRDPEHNLQFDLMKASNAREYGAERGSTKAKEDFRRRVAILTERYVSVSEPKSFIRVMNGSTHLVHNVNGYIPSKIVSFLLNISQNKIQYPIYFARHGQSEYNLDDRLGGNPPLTDKGKDDAELIRHFIAELKVSEERENHPNPMQIWTSQLVRTQQTAAPSVNAYNIHCRHWRCLNEIHAGICEGMTYAEVKKNFPLIYELRKKNKYAFRYPDGESYQDVVARLEPVIMELENANRVVFVIAHQAILRCLLSYFGHTSAETSVHVEVPHRTVWRCTYNAEGIAALDEVTLPLRSGSPVRANLPFSSSALELMPPCEEDK